MVPMDEIARDVPIEVPLDLRATLHPLGGRFRDDGWWRAARTPEGPVALRLWRDAALLKSTAWGGGADWMLDRLPALVGLGDEPGGLITDQPLVGELVRRHPGLRFGATGLVFEAVTRAVVEQKVAGKEAARSLAGLHNRFSEAAPGPRPLRLPPDPDRLAEAPYWDYHVVGIEKRRADTLRGLARHASRLDALASVPPAQARSVLQRYPGVGVWTSAETVAVSHGDPDAVSVGDFHLKNVVAWHLTGRPRGTDEEMLELLEPFRPHRGRVIRLLETLGHAPNFGARMPLRNIADR
jgi:hypothetical protein